jgi:hypothetical protein
VTVGADVFLGAVAPGPGGGLGGPETTPVGEDVAGWLLPPAPDAVSLTRMVCPTSAAVSV